MRGLRLPVVCVVQAAACHWLSYAARVHLSCLPTALPTAGAHRLEAAASHMHISANNAAYDVLVEGLTAFLQQDLSQSAAPPHVALCGCPAARWLMTCLVLQGGLESVVPAELAAAAAGLRVLLLPATQISSLPELAWSLSQQPRARFVVIVNGLESGNSTADHAAMLSGAAEGGRALDHCCCCAPSWRSNAHCHKHLITSCACKPCAEIAYVAWPHTCRL